MPADFWLRYARYLEPKDVPAAKDAVRRGQLIHCKGISEMQLFAARFHERHGDISDARAAYGLVLGRLAPGLISAVQAAANFERRQVNSYNILSAASHFPDCSAYFALVHAFVSWNVEKNQLVAVLQGDEVATVFPPVHCGRHHSVPPSHRAHRIAASQIHNMTVNMYCRVTKPLPVQPTRQQSLQQQRRAWRARRRMCT